MVRMVGQEMQLPGSLDMNCVRVTKPLTNNDKETGLAGSQRNEKHHDEHYTHLTHRFLYTWYH